MMKKKINEDVAISIIIPCYNASDYLERLSNCIDQQLARCIDENNQTVEFILVNDGSKDDTLQRLLDIKNKHPFHVAVIDQPNMGVSAARNVGLKHAKGKWIGFLDSDDVLREGALLYLSQQIMSDDVDVFIYGFKSIPDVNLISMQSFSESGNVIFKGNTLDYYLKFNPIVVWRMLYRSNLIIEKQIKFRRDITIGEDTLFNFDVFMQGISVKHVDKILVYHIDRENSLTTNVNFNYVRKVISSVLKIQDVFNRYINENHPTLSIVSKIEEHRKRQMLFVFSKLMSSTVCFSVQEIKEVRLQLESFGALPLHAVTKREHFINFCFKNPILIILLFYLRRIKMMFSRSIKNTN